ncbi:MAG: FIST signal transduction protein [Planctomycetota bacterium]
MTSTPPTPPPPPQPPTSAAPFAAAAISGHLDTRTAATEVAHELYDSLGATCDLAVLFASFHHGAAFAEAADTVRQTIRPACLIGVTADAVLGAEQELEGVAGLSVLALRLPGLELHPWRWDLEDQAPLEDPEAIGRRIGLGDEFRAAVMLVDPFTTPVARLLPALTACGGPDRPVPVVGGIASGASQPGHNRLVLNDEVHPDGAVGVSVAGAVDVDFIVSQGCRPVGTPLVVTKSKGNVIQELGGTRAWDALQEMANGLSDEEKTLIRQGLLIGSVIDEYKDHFGRGDFLVRNVLGFDKRGGGIAVGELARVGQTIQFHVRDAETAAEDLQLLLDAQQLEAPPLAALLFTCNGRGQRLFKEPNHDIGIIRERLGEVPIAGFFAAGEIGPVGDQSFLHGHTASLAIFRAKEAISD